MLSDITILITTFLRPGYLAAVLTDVALNLPECKVVVACDDEITPRDWSVEWQQLPFDSGLTAKRNACVKATTTKYALLGCDDFDFFNWETSDSITKMGKLLDANSDIDVVVGRVNNKPYEGYLEYVPGEYIKEHRLTSSEPLPLQIDIGVNFFLARTQVLRDVPWDETIRPIGGEHADWFLSMKEANKKVVYLPGANIRTMGDYPQWRSPDYGRYRWRAQQGHQIFLKKRGVKRYYSFDEKPQ